MKCVTKMFQQPFKVDELSFTNKKLRFCGFTLTVITDKEKQCVVCPTQETWEPV